ncbi:DNA-binding HxlR family transcriptional regulator [Bacillus iocasae]|uniref:DNA-binding HxlR family transcriptional regulator n=2 Tax=Priestia iocasae TaxID=2291674 RepID=A0ABS2QWS7_9BACI|nr:DNA-binding HxlR family transcriptional regulator [Metabacillus iocasae]
METMRVYSKTELSFEIISRKWMCFIVHTLANGPKRFAEISAAIPNISNRVLTERIKELEDLEIINRNVIPHRPVRIEYSLTEKGKALSDVLNEVGKWAGKWM